LRSSRRRSWRSLVALLETAPVPFCRADTAMPTLMFNKDGMASNTCNYLAGHFGEMVVDALLTGSGGRAPARRSRRGQCRISNRRAVQPL
jgi:hypothetical protein